MSTGMVYSHLAVFRSEVDFGHHISSLFFVIGCIMSLKLVS